MRRTSSLLPILALCAVPGAHAVIGARSSSTPPVVVLGDIAFNGTYANSIQPGDSAIASAATAGMRAELRGADALSLVDSARTSAAFAAADPSGAHCSASVECVRRAGQKLGARWAVVGSVSKISNLIWYMSARLIDVGSGKVAFEDEFELKGPRDEMVPRGAASLARRVERAVARETGESPGEQR